jgi:hypothetical protein
MNSLDTFISYHGGTIHAYTELEFVSNMGDLRFVSSHSELRTCVRVFEDEFFP